MSGVDLDGRQIRKGSFDAIDVWVRDKGGSMTPELRRRVETIAKEGATPLVVAEGSKVRRRNIGL